MALPLVDNSPLPWLKDSIKTTTMLWAMSDASLREIGIWIVDIIGDYCMVDIVDRVKLQ